MKTKLEQLRADMMTKGVFTRHQRRQMRYLTKANENQRQYVKSSLPLKHLARGWMETCGEVDDHGNMDYCGVPLCPRCHLRERAVQTGKAIKNIFCGVDNEQLAFATILLPPQLDFSGMSNLVMNEKRRLRTFIDRQRKKDHRWDDFQLLGWWEIDRMSFGDYETCGRNTRIALDAMGFPLMEAEDKTIWRPHLHAIVRKGELTTDEIANALRKEIHTAKYQVDIQPFRPHRDVKDNIQNIVRYCLKFRIESDYKSPDAQDFISSEQADEMKPSARDWWSAKDVRDYVNWLCVERSGFQSLRVFIGQAKDKSTANAQRALPADETIVKESDHGDISAHSISNRSADYVLELNQDNALVVEQRCFVSKSNIDIFGIRDHVRRSVYNNIIQDTNWTDISAVSGMPKSSRTVAASINGTSRYAGNEMNLSERLRSILASKQASGAL